jgi:hypothetical protein
MFVFLVVNSVFHQWTDVFEVMNTSESGATTISIPLPGEGIVNNAHSLAIELRELYPEQPEPQPEHELQSMEPATPKSSTKRQTSARKQTKSKTKASSSKKNISTARKRKAPSTARSTGVKSARKRRAYNLGQK